jgi:hypothetical protein
MVVVRAAFAVIGTLAVLAAGAWAGGGFAAPASYPNRTEAGEIRVGDALVVGGQPMRLSVFYTDDAPPQVVQYYTEAFRRRGLLPVATADSSLGHVSVFDPADGLEHSVTAVAGRSRETLVLASSSDLRQAPRFTAGSAGAPYPVPPENRAFLGYASADPGSRAHSGQYVTSLSAAQVAGFYRRELAARGWAEKKGESAEALLVFEKAGQTLSVAVQALEEAKGAAVFVTLIESAP